MRQTGSYTGGLISGRGTCEEKAKTELPSQARSNHRKAGDQAKVHTRNRQAGRKNAGR